MCICNNTKQSKDSPCIPHFRSLGVVPPRCYQLKPKRHTKKYIVALKNVVAEFVKNLVCAGFITPVVLSVIPFYLPISLPSFQSAWNETRNWNDSLGPILEKNRVSVVLLWFLFLKGAKGEKVNEKWNNNVFKSLIVLNLTVDY